MKRLLVLLIFLGCSAPTEPTDYYIRFAKQVDSVATVYNSQTFKLLQLETNLPDETRIGWESDIQLKVRIGLDASSIPWTDTVSTINCCSYTYKGTSKNVFGAFEMMKGKTATVIATTMIGTKIIADTLRVVIY